MTHGAGAEILLIRGYMLWKIRIALRILVYFCSHRMPKNRDAAFLKKKYDLPNQFHVFYIVSQKTSLLNYFWITNTV